MSKCCPVSNFQFPVVSFILARLKRAGHRAYVVGGAVRDMCLGTPAGDWDMATSAPVQEIKALFQDTSHFALQDTTVTLVHQGRHYEITPFRGEKKQISTDLALRDFTIDALAWDPDDGALLDPHGGRADLAARIVRAVGDPLERFREDPLRTLRGVRLAAELCFCIEPRTLGAVAACADSLAQIAPERIRNELLRILLSPQPSAAFNLLLRTGLLKQFLPELLEGYRRRQNAYHRHTIFKHVMLAVDNTPAEPVPRLSALFHDIAKPRVRQKIDGTWRFHGHAEAGARMTAEIMRRLRFSRQSIRAVSHLVRHHMFDCTANWSDKAVRRLIRRVGRPRIYDLLELRRADLLAHGKNRQDLEGLQRLQAKIENELRGPLAAGTQELAVNGRKVMEVLGIPPGPPVGRALRELIDKVTENPDLNREDELVELLRSMNSRSRSRVQRFRVQRLDSIEIRSASYITIAKWLNPWVKSV